MKLKDKITKQNFSIEYMTLVDGIAFIRKKHRSLTQDIYIPVEHLTALLDKFKEDK